MVQKDQWQHGVLHLFRWRSSIISQFCELMSASLSIGSQLQGSLCQASLERWQLFWWQYEDAWRCCKYLLINDDYYWSQMISMIVTTATPQQPLILMTQKHKFHHRKDNMAAHGCLLLSKSNKNQIMHYLHLLLSFRHTVLYSISSPPWKKPTMLLGGGV